VHSSIRYVPLINKKLQALICWNTEYLFLRWNSKN
jgi:hypothetical protein